jgi:hypothetical protein
MESAGDAVAVSGTGVGSKLVLTVGAESDMVGVAMGRRNMGESLVIRYCGPTGKFVS